MEQYHRFSALRLVGVIAIVTALILVVAACGSTSTSATSSPSASSAAPGPASIVPASIKQSGVLRIGSYFQNPPWSSYAADDTRLGIDVDLMTAITQVLGLKAEWIDMNWDGLRPALQTHRFDAVAANMYDYTDRQAQVTFVDYVNDGDCAAVLKGDAANVTSIESLAGKTVGVSRGSSAEIQSPKLNDKLTSQGLQPMVISEFPDDPSSFLALRAGRIYAYMGEAASVAYQCKIAQNGELFSPVLPGLLSGVMCGVVVNKDDTALANAIKAALDQLMQNGTYGKILAKYGMTAGALKAATINGGKTSSE